MPTWVRILLGGTVVIVVVIIAFTMFVALTAQDSGAYDLSYQYEEIVDVSSERN